MPSIDSEYKDYHGLQAILPDNWPRMVSGSIRCAPWVSVIFDLPIGPGSAFAAEANARDLKRAIDSGQTRWREWVLDWPEGTREALLAKIMVDVSEGFG